MRLVTVVCVAAAIVTFVAVGCSKSADDPPSPRGKIPIRTAPSRPAPTQGSVAKPAATNPADPKPASGTAGGATPVENQPAKEKQPVGTSSPRNAAASKPTAAPTTGSKPAGNAAPADDPKSESGWRLLLAQGAEAALEKSPTGTVAVAISHLPEGPRWIVQMIGPVMEVEAEKDYRIRFRARAAQPRQVLAKLCEGQSPWGSVGFEKDIELTKDWKEFSFDFTAEKSDEKATPRFYLGTDAARVEFEKIVVEPKKK